jgi:PAS domain S-box-containing protein
MSGTAQRAAEKAVTERYEALLRVSQTLISIRSSEELFRILARELRAVVNFYVMGLGIYDEKAHEVRLTSYGEPGDPLQVPKFAAEETFTWWVYQHQLPLIIPSLEAETRFPAVAEMLKNRGVRSVCALPLTTVHRRLGGLALGSIEADAYSREEVSFLSLVANQVALAVDDALNFDASQHAEEALRAAMSERTRLSAVRAEIGMALARQDTLRGMLHTCAEAMVRHLDAAFARIWTLNSDGQELELQASAGRYTRLDGRYSRIPLGQLKIGLIAQEKRAHLTNDVQNDPRIDNKDWVRDEKMTSFAGYPLVVEDRVVGVMGMFSQKPLTESTLHTLSFLADGIAQGIQRKQAEEKLRRSEALLVESEQRFRLIVDSIPGLVLTMTAEGELEFVSQQCLDYFGLTLDKLKGWTTSDIVHRDDLPRVLATWRHSIETGDPYDSEYRIRRADGIYRWFHVRALPVRDTDSRIIRWYALHADIDDRKRVEEALRASEESFRLTIASIPGLVNTMGPSGELESANQRWLDYHGKTLQEMKGWETSDVIHPDDLPRAATAWKRSVETGQPFENEYRIRRADGVYRWFQGRSLPLRNSEGRIIRWYSLITDIDERKQAEDRLQLLLDVTNKVVSNLQLQDLLRAISASVRRAMHCDLVSVCFPDSELNRLQTFVLDFPESKGFIREEFFTSIEGSLSGLVFRTGKPWMGDASDILQLGLKDEAAIPEGLKTGCILPLVSRNRVLGVLCLGRREGNGFSQDDIGFLTQVASQISIAVENVSAYSEIAHARAELEKALGETKRRTEALRRSEGYLAEAQELSHTGSFGWDVSSGEIYWSRETFRIFECEPTAKVTLELVVQRTHPEDRSAVQQLIERVSRERTKFDFEHRLLMPDGSVKYLRVVGSPSEEENGCFEFVGAVTDITERKRADDALRRSEGCLAEAQRLTRTGSWAWNLAARHSVYWSQEHYRVFGFDPEEGIPSDEAFHQRIHPEDRERVRRAVFAGREDEGSVFDVDYRIVLPGGAIKYIRSTGHPVLNASGDIIEYFGAARDMTEQHEARAALETAFEQIKALKDQLYNENIALREEIDRSSMFEEIVGASPALRAVLSRVSKVAPTDSTVLLTGETGTGKELIARAIHKRSQRSSRAFVSVSCAAIPSSLIASELFGHEKGAFTGATQRRLGRFELAEEGTLFLDEVGELPAETQIALLRVLQEREFERVGGNQPIRANVRVVAATNRDLEAAIAVGAFRSDLFYRLNVFPIEIPPLRERREDIPLLVEYFIDHFARKAGKSFRGINKKTLELLLSYPWPGNVRELQNVVERSVIVCESENFSVDESWLSPQPLASEPKSQLELSQKLAAQEKEMIEAALRESGGRVSGPSGAAAKLGIHRSTLESKITSLKIDKYRFKSASASKNS